MMSLFVRNVKLNPQKVETVIVSAFVSVITITLVAFVLSYYLLSQKVVVLAGEVNKLQEIEKVRLIQMRQSNAISTLFAELIGEKGINRSRIVRVTGYTACKTECDDDPKITASMKIIRPGKTVAVSRDLYQQGWTFGKRVWLEGYGEKEITDLMHERFKKQVDLLVASKEAAKGINVDRQVVLLD